MTPFFAGWVTARRTTQPSLRERLAGGVTPAVAKTRPDDWPRGDADALRTSGLGELLCPLYRVTDAPGLTVRQVEASLEALADQLRERRDLLIAVLFSPQEGFDQAPALAGQRVPGQVGELGKGEDAGHDDVIAHWLGLCWLAEAAWLAVTKGEASWDYATGDRNLLYPLAARLRFLALCEPMRHRPASGGNPWGKAGDYGNYGPAGRLFGTQSWNMVVGRCREARRVWRGCLNDYQTHPFLATARPEELEAELTALVFARALVPIGVSVRSVVEPAALNAEDHAHLVEVAARHMLPRFRLIQVAVLGWHAPDRRRLVVQGASASVVIATALAAVLCAVLLQVQAAAFLGGFAYLLVVAGAVLFGYRWIMPWLLRLPAAATVGLLVLVTFQQDWWLWPRAGWVAPVVLGLAALGYLVIEVRNHGVGPWAAVGRSLGVMVIGAVHALLVVAIGLTGIAPAVTAEGGRLAELWTLDPSYDQLGMALLLATAWCLAVGVFSQILWEDRPITAPLAHLSWRSGRY